MSLPSQPPPSRILFVDDEQSALNGMRRSLHRLRHRWDMTFLSSPEEALDLVAKQFFDVVVADMRMPRMNGAELLEHVRQTSPASVRFMLSGHSEVSAIMKSIGPSHQFLSKPCSSDTLERAIGRACAVRDALGSASLARILGSIRALPSLPCVYDALVSALRDELPMEHIGEIISRDVGLTTKVLQLVNSSYFGLIREVTEPARAASLLGSDTISSIVLGLKLFESLPPIVLPDITPEQLTHDASRTAAATRRLCALERVDDVFASQAFIAAFLHDVGLLTLAAYAPEQLKKIADLTQEGLGLPEAEHQAIGATHGAVGGYIAALWGFPDPVVEAIVYHHCPSRSSVTTLAPLAFVHVAQALTRNREASSDDEIDRSYLSSLGLLENLQEWLNVVDRMEGDA